MQFPCKGKFQREQEEEPGVELVQEEQKHLDHKTIRLGQIRNRQHLQLHNLVLNYFQESPDSQLDHPTMACLKKVCWLIFSSFKKDKRCKC